MEQMLFIWVASVLLLIAAYGTGFKNGYQKAVMKYLLTENDKKS